MDPMRLMSLFSIIAQSSVRIRLNSAHGIESKVWGLSIAVVDMLCSAVSRNAFFLLLRGVSISMC